MCGTFDAGEVRNAFLRVFVVLLTEYVESYTAAASGSSGSGTGSKGQGPQGHSSEESNACTVMVPFGDGKEGKEGALFRLRNNSNSSLNTIQLIPRSSSSSITSASSGTEVAKKRINFMKLNIIPMSKAAEGSSDKKGIIGKRGNAEHVRWEQAQPTQLPLRCAPLLLPSYPLSSLLVMPSLTLTEVNTSSLTPSLPLSLTLSLSLSLTPSPSLSLSLSPLFHSSPHSPVAVPFDHDTFLKAQKDVFLKQL